MFWCLIGGSIVCLFGGIATLVLPPLRPRLHHLRPGRLLRGCIALVCLVVALSFGSMAWLAAR